MATKTYYGILELGHQQPTLTTILKLAKGLRCSATDIVALVEKELPKGRRRSS